MDVDELAAEWDLHALLDPVRHARRELPLQLLRRQHRIACVVRLHQPPVGIPGPRATTLEGGEAAEDVDAEPAAEEHEPDPVGQPPHALRLLALHELDERELGDGGAWVRAVACDVEREGGVDEALRHQLRRHFLVLPGRCQVCALHATAL